MNEHTLQIIELVVSAVSVIATITLTIYTICQNTRLNKKQQELQIHIQKRQELDNHNALKLNNRQYAERVYLICFDIFAFNEILQLYVDGFSENISYDTSCQIVKFIYDRFPNISKDYKFLIIGENYLTNTLSDTVMEIRKAFSEIENDLLLFKESKIMRSLLDEKQIEELSKMNAEHICANIKILEKSKKTLLDMIETQFKI